MRNGLFGVAVLLAAVLAPAAWADDYALDPAHTGVNFRVSH